MSDIQTVPHDERDSPAPGAPHRNRLQSLAGDPSRAYPAHEPRHSTALSGAADTITVTTSSLFVRPSAAAWTGSFQFPRCRRNQTRAVASASSSSETRSSAPEPLVQLTQQTQMLNNHHNNRDRNDSS